MKFNSILALIILFSISCKKDNSNAIDEDDCLDFQISENGITFSSTEESNIQFKSPYYNPKNADEFIFYFQNFENNENSLVKYNFKTKQKIKLLDAHVSGQPKWSSSGWIAYTNSPGYVDHIFILKENGDSLMQYTQYKSNLYPAWSANGKTLFWSHSPVLGIPYFLLKKDLYNNKTDTVFSDFTIMNDLSRNNDLLAGFYYNQSLFLSTSSTQKIVFDKQIMSGAGNLLGLNWHSNGKEFFYSNYSGNGLNKFNVETKVVQLLLKSCDSFYYKSPSCSPDGENLLVERVEQVQDKDNYGKLSGKIICTSSIFIVNLKTLKKTKLNL